MENQMRGARAPGRAHQVVALIWHPFCGLSSKIELLQM